MYANIIDPTNGKIVGIFRLDDKACIALSESNSDYQAYLSWVAEGNTAEEWTGN